MPSTYLLNKAQRLVPNIRIASYDPDSPFILFDLLDEKQEVTVILNNKGWLCDWNEPLLDYQLRLMKNPDKIRWSHSFSKDQYECCHVLACKMLLKKLRRNKGDE